MYREDTVELNVANKLTASRPSLSSQAPIDLSSSDLVKTNKTDTRICGLKWLENNPGLVYEISNCIEEQSSYTHLEIPLL